VSAEHTSVWQPAHEDMKASYRAVDTTARSKKGRPVLVARCIPGSARMANDGGPVPGDRLAQLDAVAQRLVAPR
jgi:hypothetical protein